MTRRKWKTVETTRQDGHQGTSEQATLRRRSLPFLMSMWTNNPLIASEGIKIEAKPMEGE